MKTQNDDEGRNVELESKEKGEAVNPVKTDDSSGSSHRSGGSSGSSRRKSGSFGSSSRHGGSGSGSQSSKSKRSSDLDRLVEKYQAVYNGDAEDDDVKQAKKGHRRIKKRRGPAVLVIRMIAAVLAVLLIAGFAALFTLTRIGKNKLDDGEHIGIGENEYAVTYDEGRTVEYNGKKYALNENIVTAALMGVDKKTLGTSGGIIGTAGQADTIIVAAMDLKTGALTFISIPRDLIVEVNLYTVSGAYVGVENMQICLAYSYGNGKNTSCENVIASIERVLYGIPISFYAVLDLEGISALNDSIDGVTLTPIETIGSFTEGKTVTLYGERAVQYVRERKHDDINADTYRRARQIHYIKAFSEKAVKYSLGNLRTISNIYNTAAAYSHTNVTLSLATYLATNAISKGARFDNFISIEGEMKMGEKFAEFYYDERAALETVLDVFYKPIAE